MWGEVMSKTFESGVLSYIHGVAYVDNFFPVDKRGVADINCYQCRFFSRNNGICQLTKEIVSYPQKYVGAKCPLEFEDMETEDSENSQSVESTENKNQKTWKAGAF